MPYSTSPSLVSLSVGGVVRLVRCWDFVLNRGLGTLRFTQHNRPIVVGGSTYLPSDSVLASASTNEPDLSASNTNVRGVISSSAITDAMLRDGAFNGAQVTEFMVDWRFPFAGVARLIKYTISGVKWNDATGAWDADLASFMDRMSNRVGSLLGPSCRFQLGGANCGVDLGPWTRAAAVSSVVDEATFRTGVISGGAVDDEFFDDGTVTWSSGDNLDIGCTVKSFDSVTREFVLQEPTPHPIQVGDTIVAVTGCNHLSGIAIDGTVDPSGHCKHKFANLLRFGGEPTMPTNDKLYTTPAAKRS